MGRDLLQGQLGEEFEGRQGERLLVVIEHGQQVAKAANPQHHHQLRRRGSGQHDVRFHHESERPLGADEQMP